MNVTTTPQRTYSISLDRKNMRRNEMGPGPLGSRVRCFVPLKGEVDEQWRRSFRTVQLEDTGYFRFRLEMAANTVAFVAHDGEELEKELQVLEYLLNAVNTAASKVG
jgi:hypothetical protein